MEAVLGGIVSALVAGAVAKASDVGGKAIADAYDGLKSLIIRKLGKSGAVQSVEDEPQSESAQAHLAEAMANSKIANDTELAAKASDLEAKLAVIPEGSRGGSDIEVGNIRAKVNAVVERLVATGRIKLGDITAETGDARLSDLTAGAQKKT
ncbi:MAG: hypothetical protein JOY71_19290 [Acetobacteraceae bacterium]|nr:hypothetical protein [Acetobacteraceae bacterium]